MVLHTPTSPIRRSERKHLVLLGAGHAHLQVIKQWPEFAPRYAQVTLISPDPIQLYSGMMPGWVAGRYQLNECQIDVRPWLERAGIHWIQDACVGLDAGGRLLHLQDPASEPVAFDRLSIDIGSSMSLAQLEATMPGAKGRVLPIRPMGLFAAHWEAAIERAKERRIDICIVGAGAAGVELALACKAKLKSVRAQATVTLLTGGTEHLLRQYSRRVQDFATQALERAGVSVLTQRCVGFEDGAIVLENNLRLKSDLPIMTTGSMAPAWLGDSDLALDQRGYIEVNAHQQSSSHPHVFACGDIASRNDIEHPKSGVYAIRAGAQMADQLAASLRGGALKEIAVQRRSLNILNTSDGRAIATYDGWSMSGRLAQILKDYIDRRYVQSFQTLSTRTQD